MPKKYHINTHPEPPRFTTVGKFGIIDFNEKCAGACQNCVKKNCVHQIHLKENQFLLDLNSPFHYQNNCMNCLSCVQNCTKQALTRVVNPEFKRVGDSYYKPDIILTLWNQSETGSVPVSGAGYRGPFSGPGFDSMWTDMSEIVRPTRDGIHGREYISTSVDIGRKLVSLSFDDAGNLTSTPPPLLEIPVPFVFSIPDFGDISPTVIEIFARAADEMGTFFILDAAKITNKLSPFKEWIVPTVTGVEIKKFAKQIKGSKMVELEVGDDLNADIDTIKKIEPSALIILKLPLESDSDEKAEALVLKGAAVIHFHADDHGNSMQEGNNGNDREFIKDAFLRIHRRLVEKGLRDCVTLMASGGIAMAEHLAKIIICGADFVSIDIPFLIALECRMCGNCGKELACPVELSKIPLEVGVHRLLNLSAAWRNQLLEVLGAMGIREVRRLRGETGRAMFFEDLERDTFKKIFQTAGKKKKK